MGCIVNDQKHKLHQFVTAKTSKSPSKTKLNRAKITKQTKKKSPMPPPPVFQPYNEPQIELNDQSNDDNKQKKTDLDFSFLSSTLSSIQSALDVPKSVENKMPIHQNDDDFSFDFQQISNSQNSSQPRSQSMDYGYYAANNYNAYPQRQNVGGGYYDNMNNDNLYTHQPPKKKQKISSTNIGNEQLTDLLSYLCEDNKNTKQSTESADNLSQKSRYPKPKAPAMNDMNTDNNVDSGWTNVVDRF